MDDTSVYNRIMKRTKDAFGIGINPHLFRDALATSLAINEPEIVGISHAMLGNTPAVCQRFYNLAKSHQAGRRLNHTLGSLRERLKKRPK